jgi:hypothetical protein
MRRLVNGRLLLHIGFHIFLTVTVVILVIGMYAVFELHQQNLASPSQERVIQILKLSASLGGLASAESGIVLSYYGRYRVSSVYHFVSLGLVAYAISI